MTSTLAQIAMILTVAAPLQAVPTTQPATQAPRAHVYDTVEAFRPGYTIFADAGDDALPGDTAELQEQVAVQAKEIATLKESLAKPDLTDTVSKINAMYDKALNWMLGLFGVLVGAITILAILICGVLPWLAGRRERERQSRSDKALTETQEALRTAHANLMNMQSSADEKLNSVERALAEKTNTDRQELEAQINTDRQELEAQINTDRRELEAQINTDRQELDAKIKRASNMSTAALCELEGDMRAEMGMQNYALFLYLTSAHYAISGRSTFSARSTMEKALRLQWSREALDADSDRPGAKWRMLDFIIEAFEQDDDKSFYASIIADLKERRAEFGPEAYAAAEAPDANDTPAAKPPSEPPAVEEKE